ncbi:MAG: CPBP family intramembrane metalloprotease [Acidobacteriia bacterium]|nr:CPBP family intramembrane metalloprotease [Terriglobia bacterium]
MQSVFLALLLAAIFGFFAPAVQCRVRGALQNRPRAVWAIPFLLTAIFASASVLAGAFSMPLALLVLGYTGAPVLCAFVQGAGTPPRPTALDFLSILLLWLPLEFAAGVRQLVPRTAQGYLHSVAYGIAILLGLVLFLGYRPFAGLKYNLPLGKRDFWLPLAAFALLAPVLIVVGMAIGFIPPPHWPTASGGSMAAAVGIVFAATALPEEILFRALIQNLMMQRFGSGARTLLAASFLFGCAHLDNGPQPLPNWRYLIVATVAGWAYGKVFQESSTVLSSAALHTLVDWTKHFFF